MPVQLNAGRAPHIAIVSMLIIPSCLMLPPAARAQALTFIRVADSKDHFVDERSHRFNPWGVNYDHDKDGNLLESYWVEDWDAVEGDFREAKDLGVNVIRIHLQIADFMTAADTVDSEALKQLEKLLQLAENVKVYLNITGLGCYHKNEVPAWYDHLSEAERCAVQARFWSAVSQTCAASPAVFCYDLMNEPVLPGDAPVTSWLAGEFAGKNFVQYLTKDLKGRTRHEVAKAWVRQMCEAIRTHDRRHLITVGVIPWVLVFGGGQPLFYDRDVAEPLDFASIHVYLEAGKAEKTIELLQAYKIGKPLIIEETFPLKCSIPELREFILADRGEVTGWFSFYWGATSSELRSKSDPTIADAITADWLDAFQSLAPAMR